MNNAGGDWGTINTGPANTFSLGTSASGTTTNVKALTWTNAGLVALPAIGTDSGQTATASVCEDTTTHALYFGSGAVGICKGTSSVRFKTDILPLISGLDDLIKLSTVTYRLKPGYGDSTRKLYGFTAEQMFEVFPELVWLDEDGRPTSIDWAGLLPIIVNSIKDMNGQIDQLKGSK